MFVVRGRSSSIVETVVSRSGPRIAVMALCVACLLAAANSPSEPPPKPEPAAIVAGETLRVSAIRGVGLGGPGDQKVDDALWRIVTIRNHRFSLATFAEALEAVLQVPVVIDQLSFEDAGRDLATEFSVDVSETTVHELLSSLDEVEAGYNIRHGRLVLQYRFEALEARTLRVYNVASLSAPVQERITELVVAQCDGPWDVDEPGTGTIQRLGMSLLVRTNLTGQAEVETFLNLLAANVPGPTK